MSSEKQSLAEESIFDLLLSGFRKQPDPHYTILSGSGISYAILKECIYMSIRTQVQAADVVPPTNQPIIDELTSKFHTAMITPGHAIELPDIDTIRKIPSSILVLQRDLFTLVEIAASYPSKQQKINTDYSYALTNRQLASMILIALLCRVEMKSSKQAAPVVYTSFKTNFSTPVLRLQSMIDFVGKFGKFGSGLNELTKFPSKYVQLDKSSVIERSDKGHDQFARTNRALSNETGQLLWLSGVLLYYNDCIYNKKAALGVDFNPIPGFNGLKKIVTHFCKKYDWSHLSKQNEDGMIYDQVASFIISNILKESAGSPFVTRGSGEYLASIHDGTDIINGFRLLNESERMDLKRPVLSLGLLQMTDHRAYRLLRSGLVHNYFGVEPVWQISFIVAEFRYRYSLFGSIKDAFNNRNEGSDLEFDDFKKVVTTYVGFRDDANDSNSKSRYNNYLNV